MFVLCIGEMDAFIAVGFPFLGVGFSSVFLSLFYAHVPGSLLRHSALSFFVFFFPTLLFLYNKW